MPVIIDHIILYFPIRLSYYATFTFPFLNDFQKIISLNSTYGSCFDFFIVPEHLIANFDCIVLYCIVFYCTVLNCNVLYCIVLLYCIVMHCIVLHGIVLYCITTRKLFEATSHLLSKLLH